MEKAPVTLGSLAMQEAIRAAKGHDESTYMATVALSLIMANSQVDAIVAEKEIDHAKNKATFRAFCKEYAFRGNMVWRDTQHLVDAILATPTKDNKRRAAASDYIDKKPEGSRLVDGLARLRTWSFRLMKDVVTNHANVIRDIRALRDAGADAVAQRDRFRVFVATTYGANFSELSTALASDTPRKKVDAIESILKRAKEMTDSDLQSLVAQLQQLWSERLATASEISEEFGESTESTETAPEAPVAPVTEAKPERKRRAANG
jgi:hypothetical protein